MIKIIISVLVMIAAVALTTQHLRTVEVEFMQQLLQDTEQAETIHIFNQFTLSNTDETGAIESQLKSPATRYIASEQKTHLESPTMLVYRKQNSPVKISAESAIVDHQTNITTLHNNVDVSMDGDSKKPLRMTTEILEIDNTAQIATTSAAARIYYGKSRMDGTGLKLDLKRKQVKFLDKVHGLYEQ